jgi:two-component system, LuxR family, response regulator FixJ
MPVEPNKGASPAPESAVVFVVDDDAAMRDSLREVLDAAGLRVETFARPDELLERLGPEQPGCVVLDLLLPEKDGLTVQQELHARGIELPIIFLTGHGNLHASSRAFRAGAVDFLEKPVRAKLLVDRVREALAQQAQRQAHAARQALWQEALARLTPRDREIFQYLVAGKVTKEIAATLGISTQAVDAHRARILRTMEVSSVVELVRTAVKLGAAADPSTGSREG